MTFDVHPEADEKTEDVAVAFHEMAVNRLGFATEDVLFTANPDGTVEGKIAPRVAVEEGDPR